MKRVLLIEDDMAFRGYLRDLLRASGFDVECCVNGLEPLAVVRRRPPELVVTNIRMPGEKGLGTTYELRRQIPDVPIIAVAVESHYPFEYQKMMAELIGAHAIIARPFEWTDFLSTVDELSETERVWV